MKYIIFMSLILWSSVKAQNNLPKDPVLKQLEQQLRHSQNLFEQFFKDDFFNRMDQQFFKQADLIDGNWARALGGDLKTSWKETENAKVLVVEGEISGKDPLDIQVKNGMISLKGTVEKEREINGNKTVEKYQFHRSYSVPKGTDVAQMNIEKKGEKELWLIFPYITETAKKKKKRDDGLRPLKSKDSDPTI